MDMNFVKLHERLDKQLTDLYLRVGELEEEIMSLKSQIKDAKRYIEFGMEPGSFMLAVLANDLIGAFLRADHDNREAMFQWVKFLQAIPTNAWGSYEEVNKYMESKRKEADNG